VPIFVGSDFESDADWTTLGAGGLTYTGSSSDLEAKRSTTKFAHGGGSLEISGSITSSGSTSNMFTLAVGKIADPGAHTHIKFWVNSNVYCNATIGSTFIVSFAANGQSGLVFDFGAATAADQIKLINTAPSAYTATGVNNSNGWKEVTISIADLNTGAGYTFGDGSTMAFAIRCGRLTGTQAGDGATTKTTYDLYFDDFIYMTP
jgi:hypothetical protein